MRWGQISIKMYTTCLLLGAGAWLFVIEAAAASMQVQTYWVFGQ
jgi:hypothetical protein